MKWFAQNASRVPTWNVGTSLVSASIAIQVHTFPTCFVRQPGVMGERNGRMPWGIFFSLA